MKLRKGLIVGMASLLGVTALAGCKDKDKNKVVSTVEMHGISRKYAEGASIDWSKLTITANYKDGSSSIFSNFEYDVEAITGSDTEAVVYTTGLHAQSAAEEGTYAISVAFKEDLGKKYELGSISVMLATPENFALVGFFDPALKSGYENNIKGAGTEIEPERNDREVAKANENKFIGSDKQYIVGTSNVFKYEPEVIFRALGDSEAVLISGEDIMYNKVYEVKVKSGNEYVEAPTTDYSLVDGYVKFSESAIGKIFSIKVTLTDFDSVIGSEDAPVSTFEGFTVQKGLNIYNAKQLGILNISKLTKEELFNRKFNDHMGDSDNMFWNGTDYYRPFLPEIWREFLLNTGTYTAEELTAYADSPAVFLQKKINVTPADIPADYFIKDGELANNVHVGCPRDGIPLYAPIVDATDVEINGNFFTLDTTAIPLCKNTNSSNGPKPYTDPNTLIEPGHTPVFKFCGIESGDEAFFNNQVLSVEGKGIIRNMNTIGNTGVDLISKDFEKMLTLTGLIFAKNDYCSALYENCIIKQYQIGLFGDNMIGQAYGDKPQTDYTIIKEVRVYDCANSGIFNYHNGGIHVSKSVFNRFGASPLMNAGVTDLNRTPNTKFTPDVIFNNEITGEEIYFSALGATEAVGTIKGFNSLFAALGNIFTYTVQDKTGKDVTVMNLVSIGINGADYLAADTPEYYSNVYLNAGADNQLQASVKANTYQWGVFSNLRETIYNAKYQEAWNSDDVKKMHDDAYAEQYALNMDKEARNYIVTNPDHIEQFVNFEGWDPDDVPRMVVDNLKENSDFIAAFEAQFNPIFEAAFEEEFKKQFDAAFNEQYQQPPVFQTEVASELFWTDLENIYTATGAQFATQLEGSYVHLLVGVADTALSLVFRIGKLPAAE